MEPDELSGHLWRFGVVRRGADEERGREALGRLIAEDHDPAEVSYFEAMSDPQVLRLEKAQRSYAGQFVRRLRRRAERARQQNGRPRPSAESQQQG
jgi:hypothetical protein